MLLLARHAVPMFRHKNADENLLLMINQGFLAIRYDKMRLDGCIVWNAHNTVLGEEALLNTHRSGRLCYVKTGL